MKLARLTRLSVLAALFLACSALGACSAFGTHRPAAFQVEHVVLMWLKQPGDEAALARIRAAGDELAAEIPGIVSMSAGPPLPNDNEVVDDSFDIAFVMRFRNAQALADYIVHPVHQRAVDEVLSPAAARIRVYDVVVR